MIDSIEQAYCSWCFQLTRHNLESRNYLSRNVYRCASCGGFTLECRLCRNMSRANEGWVNWDDQFCAEHNGTIASFERLDMRLTDITEFREIFRRESINARHIAKIATFMVGGAVVLGPLSAIATPGLTSLALGSSGLGIIEATGSALGGTLGGVVANSYFSDVEGFDITLFKPGQHPRVIFIDGFLTQENDEPTDWINALKHLYPNNAWYQLNWESKCLYDLGKHIGGAAAGKEILEKVLSNLATKQSRVPDPIIGAALKITGLATNPWHVALFKAAQTGILLADIITRTGTTYILCGHSLGARVIFYALADLATRTDQALIDTVHLLGGAVDNRLQDWEALLPAVSKTINNYYSDNDLVLKTLYKCGTALLSTPIGLKPIASGHPALVDHDVTNWVEGHFSYKENFQHFAKI